MQHWRLIVDAPASGAANMARDVSLFEGVQAGGRPVLRLYRWQPACLSFGRNQHAAGLCDVPLAAAQGIDIVRRPTGGQAVFHHHELTYAVALPVAALGGPRATYAAINRALARGLRRLGIAAVTQDSEVPLSGLQATMGVPAAARSPGRPSAPRFAALADTRVSIATLPHPCFQQAAPGEVTVAGRKLVGSAQRCERHTILQHGSILLRDDQAVVLHLMGGSADAPAAVGIGDLLAHEPTPQTLRQAIVAGFREELECDVTADGLTRVERARALQLESHFAGRAWTWRR